MINNKLRNGVELPSIGYGTSHNGGYKHEATIHAIQTAGYRLIDTAERYGSEKWIGQNICACGVPRDQLFITSKLDPGP